MIIYLIIVGILALIFGVLFLVSPNTISNLSKKLDKIVFNLDKQAHELRVGMGVSLILISILAFFIAYYIMRKYG